MNPVERAPHDEKSHPKFAPAAVELKRLPGGELLLRSPLELGAYPERLGQHLRRWAREAPERTFLAERGPAGRWEALAYREALTRVERIAQGLLDRGHGPDRPAMILSGNSVDHALLALACLHVGIPVAPVAPAYSLRGGDYAKLRSLAEFLSPGLVYAASGTRFARAIAALPRTGFELIVSREPPEGSSATLLTELASREPREAMERAYAAVGPDTIAKILFPSGPGDVLRGVINTQRMLCSTQQAIVQVWPFLEEKPPVLLDWLPWNHTFGGNKNFNLVLRNGGTLYIDRGRPAPGEIEKTIANLREVSPTLCLTVPRGLEALVPYLEADPGLRDNFFRDLDLIFYAAAALPQSLWERLERLSLDARGEKVPITSGWGNTETAPVSTQVHYPISRAGVIGLPVPGVEVKMVPRGGKMEMRVRGPNVMPGYYKRPDLTARAFDGEGFYRFRDAGRFVDPEDLTKGLAFDGRIRGGSEPSEEAEDGGGQDGLRTERAGVEDAADRPGGRNESGGTGIHRRSSRQGRGAA